MRFVYLAFAMLLVAFAVAAPVPKQARKDDLVDLKKLQDRIAQAVKKDDWTDNDTRQIEEAVNGLLVKMCKAAETDERSLPVEFDKLERLAPDKLKAGVVNALIVGEDVKSTSANRCVILADGTVKFTALKNCVVVAREVRCTSVVNSVVIAAEYARATGFGDRLGDHCVVIAGEHIRAASMYGGFVHVLRPGTGTAPADDRREGPIAMTSACGVTFFGTEEKLRFADKDCKWVELKTPIAK